MGMFKEFKLKLKFMALMFHVWRIWYRFAEWVRRVGSLDWYPIVEFEEPKERNRVRATRSEVRMRMRTTRRRRMK